MGQKHNRRRTRYHAGNHANAIAKRSAHSVAEPAPLPFCGYKTALFPSRTSQACEPVPAQTWQNRYIASQNRERRQYPLSSRLEAERCRLFGGEPGDDVDLCYRMLEYFGGLDYIDA
ncbi:hypothetical protein PRK78_000255 [Emydomyces testavorans]|uniref:Uncharacterized protein n=1 Tax=Emydomyces testavorans TaxID=2070801 RepID=A0AAF0DB00_9EURO|nr:hypothetical protein PRK78_000255 [Emydomyces testavorans]